MLNWARKYIWVEWLDIWSSQLRFRNSWRKFYNLASMTMITAFTHWHIKSLVKHNPVHSYLVHGTSVDCSSCRYINGSSLFTLLLKTFFKSLKRIWYVIHGAMNLARDTDYKVIQKSLNLVCDTQEFWVNRVTKPLHLKISSCFWFM